MSLRRHQLPHDYSGCARLVTARHPSSFPHNGAQDVTGVVGPVWRLSPNKIPTQPILAVQSEWPGSLGERTGHSARVVTQSHCCRCAVIGSAVVTLKGTSGGAACSARSCCRNLA